MPENHADRGTDEDWNIQEANAPSDLEYRVTRHTPTPSRLCIVGVRDRARAKCTWDVLVLK